MKITAIHVLDFPAYTSNGFAWDTNGTAPDIYVSLWDSGNNYELYSTGWLSNTLPPDEGYHWPFNNLNWSVNPNATYRFKLYDDDTLDFDDYMGQFHAIIYTNDNGFPNQSTFTNDNVSFRVYFDYEW